MFTDLLLALLTLRSAIPREETCPAGGDKCAAPGEPLGRPRGVVDDGSGGRAPCKGGADVSVLGSGGDTA